MNKNKDIKGIYIDNSEYLISQFVDDAVLIQDGSEKSLNVALEEFYIFFRSSGLKINLSETQAVSIGNKRYSTEQIRENIYMKTTTTLKLLGIFFELNKINVNPENNNIKSNIPTLFRSCLSQKKEKKQSLYSWFGIYNSIWSIKMGNQICNYRRLYKLPFFCFIQIVVSKREKYRYIPIHKTQYKLALLNQLE